MVFLRSVLGRPTTKVFLCKLVSSHKLITAPHSITEFKTDSCRVIFDDLALANGITIASLGLGYYGEPAIAHLIEPYLAVIMGVEPSATILHTVSYILILSLLTYLHVVVGEMVPKSLALAAADRVVLTIYPAMMVAETALKLPVRLLNNIGILILKLLFLFLIIIIIRMVRPRLPLLIMTLVLLMMSLTVRMIKSNRMIVPIVVM